MQDTLTYEQARLIKVVNTFATILCRELEEVMPGVQMDRCMTRGDDAPWCTTFVGDYAITITIEEWTSKYTIRNAFHDLLSTHQFAFQAARAVAGRFTYPRRDV